MTFYGGIPYYTDVVKCGVARQNRGEKGVLKVRAEKCFNVFLSHEIKIIQPKYILCLGAYFRPFLEEQLKLIPEIKNCNVIPLMHYSRQASLPLSIEDKYMIWSW